MDVIWSLWTMFPSILGQLRRRKKSHKGGARLSLPFHKKRVIACFLMSQTDYKFIMLKKYNILKQRILTKTSIQNRASSVYCRSKHRGMKDNPVWKQTQLPSSCLCNSYFLLETGNRSYTCRK